MRDIWIIGHGDGTVRIAWPRAEHLVDVARFRVVGDQLFAIAEKMLASTSPQTATRLLDAMPPHLRVAVVSMGIVSGQDVGFWSTAADMMVRPDWAWGGVEENKRLWAERWILNRDRLPAWTWKGDPAADPMTTQWAKYIETWGAFDGERRNSAINHWWTTWNVVLDYASGAAVGIVEGAQDVVHRFTEECDALFDRAVALLDAGYVTAFREFMAAIRPRHRLAVIARSIRVPVKNDQEWRAQCHGEHVDADHGSHSDESFLKTGRYELEVCRLAEKRWATRSIPSRSPADRTSLAMEWLRRGVHIDPDLEIVTGVIYDDSGISIEVDPRAGQALGADAKTKEIQEELDAARKRIAELEMSSQKDLCRYNEILHRLAKKQQLPTWASEGLAVKTKRQGAPVKRGVLRSAGWTVVGETGIVLDRCDWPHELDENWCPDGEVQKIKDETRPQPSTTASARIVVQEIMARITADDIGRESNKQMAADIGWLSGMVETLCNEVDRLGKLSMENGKAAAQMAADLETIRSQEVSSDETAVSALTQENLAKEQIAALERGRLELQSQIESLVAEVTKLRAEAQASEARVHEMGKKTIVMHMLIDGVCPRKTGERILLPERIAALVEEIERLRATPGASSPFNRSVDTQSALADLRSLVAFHFGKAYDEAQASGMKRAAEMQRAAMGPAMNGHPALFVEGFTSILTLMGILKQVKGGLDSILAGERDPDPRGPSGEADSVERELTRVQSEYNAIARESLKALGVLESIKIDGASSKPMKLSEMSERLVVAYRSQADEIRALRGSMYALRNLRKRSFDPLDFGRMTGDLHIISHNLRDTAKASYGAVVPALEKASDDIQRVVGWVCDLRESIERIPLIVKSKEEPVTMTVGERKAGKSVDTTDPQSLFPVEVDLKLDEILCSWLDIAKEMEDELRPTLTNSTSRKMRKGVAALQDAVSRVKTIRGFAHALRDALEKAQPIAKDPIGINAPTLPPFLAEDKQARDVARLLKRIPQLADFKAGGEWDRLLDGWQETADALTAPGYRQDLGSASSGLHRGAACLRAVVSRLDGLRAAVRKLLKEGEEKQKEAEWVGSAVGAVPVSAEASPRGANDDALALTEEKLRAVASALHEFTRSDTNQGVIRRLSETARELEEASHKANGALAQSQLHNAAKRIEGAIMQLGSTPLWVAVSDALGTKSVAFRPSDVEWGPLAKEWIEVANGLEMMACQRDVSLTNAALQRGAEVLREGARLLNTLREREDASDPLMATKVRVDVNVGGKVTSRAVNVEEVAHALSDFAKSEARASVLAEWATAADDLLEAATSSSWTDAKKRRLRRISASIRDGVTRLRASPLWLAVNDALGIWDEVKKNATETQKVLVLEPVIAKAKAAEWEEAIRVWLGTAIDLERADKVGDPKLMAEGLRNGAAVLRAGVNLFRSMKASAQASEKLHQGEPAKAGNEGGSAPANSGESPHSPPHMDPNDPSLDPVRKGTRKPDHDAALRALADVEAVTEAIRRGTQVTPQELRTARPMSGPTPNEHRNIRALLDAIVVLRQYVTAARAQEQAKQGDAGAAAREIQEAFEKALKSGRLQYGKMTYTVAVEHQAHKAKNETVHGSGLTPANEARAKTMAENIGHRVMSAASDILVSKNPAVERSSDWYEKLENDLADYAAVVFKGPNETLHGAVLWRLLHLAKAYRDANWGPRNGGGPSGSSGNDSSHAPPTSVTNAGHVAPDVLGQGLVTRVREATRQLRTDKGAKILPVGWFQDVDAELTVYAKRLLAESPASRVLADLFGELVDHALAYQEIVIHQAHGAGYRWGEGFESGHVVGYRIEKDMGTTLAQVFGVVNEMPVEAREASVKIASYINDGTKAVIEAASPADALPREWFVVANEALLAFAKATFPNHEHGRHVAAPLFELMGLAQAYRKALLIEHQAAGKPSALEAELAGLLEDLRPVMASIGQGSEEASPMNALRWAVLHLRDEAALRAKSEAETAEPKESFAKIQEVINPYALGTDIYTGLRAALNEYESMGGERSTIIAKLLPYAGTTDPNAVKPVEVIDGLITLVKAHDEEIATLKKAAATNIFMSEVDVRNARADVDSLYIEPLEALAKLAPHRDDDREDDVYSLVALILRAQLYHVAIGHLPKGALATDRLIGGPSGFLAWVIGAGFGRLVVEAAHAVRLLLTPKPKPKMVSVGEAFIEPTTGHLLVISKIDVAPTDDVPETSAHGFSAGAVWRRASLTTVDGWTDSAPDATSESVDVSALLAPYEDTQRKQWIYCGPIPEALSPTFISPYSDEILTLRSEIRWGKSGKTEPFYPPTPAEEDKAPVARAVEQILNCLRSFESYDVHMLEAKIGQPYGTVMEAIRILVSEGRVAPINATGPLAIRATKAQADLWSLHDTVRMMNAGTS